MGIIQWSCYRNDGIHIQPVEQANGTGKHHIVDDVREWLDRIGDCYAAVDSSVHVLCVYVSLARDAEIDVSYIQTPQIF